MLSSFKSLHRTCLKVFRNNKNILYAAQKEINESYKKNKNVTEEDSIKNLIKLANNVQYELKTTVCELEQTGPDVYSESFYIKYYMVNLV